MHKDSVLALSVAIVLIAILMTGLIVLMQVTLGEENVSKHFNKGLCVCPKEKS